MILNCQATVFNKIYINMCLSSCANFLFLYSKRWEAASCAEYTWSQTTPSLQSADRCMWGVICIYRLRLFEQAIKALGLEIRHSQWVTHDAKALNLTVASCSISPPCPWAVTLDRAGSALSGQRRDAARWETVSSRSVSGNLGSAAEVSSSNPLNTPGLLLQI